MNKEKLAKRLFNAYNDQGPKKNQWKTFDGRDVPKWEQLTPSVLACPDHGRSLVDIELGD